MTTKERIEIENLKADIVIIGGGGAGLAAALAAAEKGASVTVLEKRGVGGNSALAQGLFAAESQVQKREWIDCQKDDCFRKVMDYTRWRTNPRILRAFIDKSADTIRWLEEKGLKFDCSRSYPNDAVPTWHLIDGGGARLIKVLVSESKKLGAELFTRAPVEKILTSKEGEITGVLAKKDGKDYTITTRTVIVATGGYGGNKRLLKKYCPDYRDNMKLIGIGYAGDGFRMAMELGAATEGLGVMQLFGPCIDFIDRSLQLRLGVSPDIFTIPLLSMVSEPTVVWVNKLGKRFIDETIFGPTGANAAVRQPDNLSYTLFDSNIVQKLTENGLFMGGSKFKDTRGKKLIGLERELQAHAAKGVLKIAQSWDEIANWIGANPSTLKTTINEYNNACERGYDKVFLKNRRFLVPLSTPPFYAIETRAEFHGTIGGIKINENMEVIDNQDKPIPGLYAAGVDTGGWQIETYGPLSGTAFGFAVNSGRIAGENAAEYIRLKS